MIAISFSRDAMLMVMRFLSLPHDFRKFKGRRSWSVHYSKRFYTHRITYLLQRRFRFALLCLWDRERETLTRHQAEWMTSMEVGLVVYTYLLVYKPPFFSTTRWFIHWANVWFKFCTKYQNQEILLCINPLVFIVLEN